MKKFFNLSGPCHPEEHYMLPPQERCKGIPELIEEKQYFVLHAARQSGKTTLLLDLVQELNASEKYYALYCSLETIHGISDPKEGIPAILEELEAEVEIHESLEKIPFLDEREKSSSFHVRLRKSLARFCKKLDKPLVILFDEIDCLSNGTLISFLRQLRYGFINRNRSPFVSSVALVGMRNIRDYKTDVREEEKTLGSASPFNIAKESKQIRNFTQQEIAALFSQHSDLTGQVFSSRIVEKIFDYSQGQPWLVNAIASEIVKEILHSDFSREILPEQVEQAVQTIILRRDTHIDSLMERLKEKRVQKIIEPLILGESKTFEPLDDDYQYVQDLGLLRLSEKRLIPANPIYAEVILRLLTSRPQQELDQKNYPPELPAFLVGDKIDMKQLLGDFQQFWQENSEIWIEKYEYKEAAPHLILQAFLQKVINSGGRISREMALGLGRLDLCLHYRNYNYPIELKIRYGKKTYTEGKTQLAGYMDKLGCQEGWLVVFDRNQKTPWDKKIFCRSEKVENKTIHILGC